MNHEAPAIIEASFGEHPCMVKSVRGGYQLAGINQYIKGEQSALRDRGYVTELLGLSTHRPRHRSQSEGMPVIQIPGDSPWFPEFESLFENKTYRSLVQRTKQYVRNLQEKGHRIPFVRSHYWVSQIAGEAARQLDIPTIFTSHTTDVMRAPALGRPPNRIRQQVESEAFFSADATIVSTQSERDGIIAHLGIRSRDIETLSHRIRVIAPGVDPLFCPTNRLTYRESMRKQLGIRPDTVVFAASGRLIPHKNHHQALLAFEHMMHEHPNTDAVFLLRTGTGDEKKLPYHGFLIRLLRDMPKHIRKQVIWMPFGDKQLENLLSPTDVYVSLSAYETFEYGVTEAAASGLPVIASAIPVHNEVLQRTSSHPWSIPIMKITDEIPITSALMYRAACDKEFRDEEAKRLQHVCASYTWDKFISQLLKLI